MCAAWWNYQNKLQKIPQKQPWLWDELEEIARERNTRLLYCNPDQDTTTLKWMDGWLDVLHLTFVALGALLCNTIQHIGPSWPEGPSKMYTDTATLQQKSLSLRNAFSVTGKVMHNNLLGILQITATTDQSCDKV